MRQTIRVNTFETNSSSTHNCVISTEKERDAWAAGDLFWVQYSDNKFLTKEEVEKEYEAAEDNGEFDSFEEWCFDNDYISFENFAGDFESECNSRQIGEETIYVDCYYGYDG